MENSTLSRRTHAEEVAILQKLTPIYRHGIAELRELAMRFSHQGWKDFFVHLWAQQSNGLVELENKISELGGDNSAPPQEEMMNLLDIDEVPVDPLLLDKMLLSRCVNQET